jgi:hypothetical protein
MPSIYGPKPRIQAAAFEAEYEENLLLPPPSQLAQFPFCRPNSDDFNVLHHYRSNTAASLSDEISIKRLFQVEMLELSSSYPFLGHGILSIAYSHTALLSDQARLRSRLTADASWHLSVALPYYLQSIGNITQENCNVLFAFATLMILHTMVNASDDFGGLLSAPRSAADHIQLLKSLAHIVIRVTQNTRGIFFVFFRYKKWIAKGTLSPVAQRHAAPILTGPQTTWASREDSRLSDLELLWRREPGLSDGSKQALSEALHHLRGAFRAVTQLTVLSDPGNAAAEVDLGEIHRQLMSGRLDDLPCAFTWQVSISPTYLSMLEQQNPFAMVLLAHYAILLDRACSRAWWMRRLPSQLVATASLVLENGMRPWIEWPINVVGVWIPEGQAG